MTRLSRWILVSAFAAGTGVGCSGAETEDVGAQASAADDLPVGTDASEEPLVFAESDGGAPTVMYGNFRAISAGETSERAFAQAIDRAAIALRVPQADLRFVRAERDELGFTHARYLQQRNGLDVIGGDVALHADARGQVFAVSGHVALSTVQPEQAALSADDASWIAVGEARPGVSLTNTATPRLVYLVTEDHAGSRLAWEVVVEGETELEPVRDFVYVDATSGALLASHPKIHSAKKRDIYTAKNASTTPGSKARSEGQAASSNVDVNAAYDNLGYVYDFYSAKMGRDSFDGEGATLIATVNYGNKYNNAYWNGTQMVFGDGDGTNLSPLARSLDVTAHEMTHAVTERTADLIYSGESGGLNEAMSDIFGNTVEAWADGGESDYEVSDATWLVGEDVWTPSTPGDALRYMADPARDGDSLDDYKDYNWSVDVHYSSGIANLAYKLLVTGGKHPRGKSSAEVPALGMEKASQIFYRALSKYMQSGTNFQGARVATAQAATDLYGAQAAAAVHKAWDALNVPGSPGGGSGGGTGDVLEDGVSHDDLSGAKRSSTYFTIRVPSGARSLSVSTQGGSGDADIYVRFNKKPTTATYDKRSAKDGNDESVGISGPKAGTYHVMVRGYSAYSGLSIVANY